MTTCKYALVNKLIAETSALDLLTVVAGPAAVVGWDPAEVVGVSGDRLGVEFDVATIAVVTAVLPSST